MGLPVAVREPATTQLFEPMLSRFASASAIAPSSPSARDGPSGRCPRTGHDPVVRANAIPLRLTFGEEVVGIVRLRSLHRRGEADLLGGELVILQNVFWHRAGV